MIPSLKRKPSASENSRFGEPDDLNQPLIFRGETVSFSKASINDTYNFINKNLPNMRGAMSSNSFFGMLGKHHCIVPCSQCQGKELDMDIYIYICFQKRTSHEVVANKRYDIYTGVKKKELHLYIYTNLYIDI